MKWLLCLSLSFSAVAYAAEPLPSGVLAELKRVKIPPQNVSVVLQEIGSTEARIQHQATQVTNPASTMKLLTTLAGVQLLGANYRWKTEAYLNGKLENGVLNGDLVFKGYGDPKLTVEQLWLWLSELRQRGLREIRGDVLLDRSFFAQTDIDQGAFDNAPTRAYNVGPNALLLNFNVFRLRLVPNGTQIQVLVEPELAGYTFKNQLRMSNLSCNADDAYQLRLADNNTIVLEGQIPQNCGEIDDYYSLLSHNAFFLAVFKSIWQQLGGSIQGTLREATLSGNPTPFSTRWSPPLSEVIRDINKFSNNTLARQLFLTLGTNNGSQGSIENSKETILAWLQQNNLKFPELVLENGSGLSRNERISAQHLADLLQLGARNPLAAEFTASLPILGIDGTTRRRFKNTPIAGSGHFKTGSLENVRALAGYIHGNDGKQWALVFIINHPNAKLGQAAQDALIEWVQTPRQ